MFPPFDRRFLESDEAFTQVGHGPLGGKAEGLAFIHAEVVPALKGTCPAGVEVAVPRMLILASSMFDAFMERNRLVDVAASDLPDDRIAHAFMLAELPAELVGDLHALMQTMHTPLAVRSSSLLEDALAHPFAGVYGTKMVPNHQHGAAERFARLTEAVKFVYASTFFASATAYRRALGIPEGEEKMSVIIQEVMGRRHNSRFYPDISGVARSYSYYPLPGSRPADGTISLALGLGKTVVDGETCWVYTPNRPAAPAPMNSPHSVLQQTQTTFWAINMTAASYDPVRETEFLVHPSLAEAELDGTLRHIASTYDAASDRVRPGMERPGPRVVDFAPLLRFNTLPLNECLRSMLATSRETLGCEVELEFAALLPSRDRSTLDVGYLQLRPMARPGSEVEVEARELLGEHVVAASSSCLGNGVLTHLRDVVFVKPQTFDPAQTPRIAREIGVVNGSLLCAGKGYILVGFGRWGTADPWLGIPVEWGQISGAKVVVETALSSMRPEMSQGSHFFHNLIGARTLYLSVPLDTLPQVDWEWLSQQKVVQETNFVCHVRATTPLTVRVDGRSGRGVITRHD